MSEAEENNKALVRRFWEAQDKCDLETIDELLVPDFIDHDPLPGQEPGREGFMKGIAEGCAAHSHVRTTIEYQAAVRAASSACLERSVATKILVGKATGSVRTTITGQRACLTMESETLPMRARLTPPSPLLPKAIRPAPISSATRTTSSEGWCSKPGWRSASLRCAYAASHPACSIFLSSTSSMFWACPRSSSATSGTRTS